MVFITIDRSLVSHRLRELVLVVPIAAIGGLFIPVASKNIVNLIDKIMKLTDSGSGRPPSRSSKMEGKGLGSGQMMDEVRFIHTIVPYIFSTL